jgi:hypothetical protein
MLQLEVRGVNSLQTITGNKVGQLEKASRSLQCLQKKAEG